MMKDYLVSVLLVELLILLLLGTTSLIVYVDSMREGFEKFFIAQVVSKDIASSCIKGSLIISPIIAFILGIFVNIAIKE